MFNTWLQFKNKNDTHKLINHFVVISRSRNDDEDQDLDKNMNWKNDWVMLIRLNCDSDTDDNVSRYYDSDSDSETDDGIDAGLDEIKVLTLKTHHFYHHI